MDWIKDNKGAGAWAFTKQPNKWGYLNNPRWMTTQSEPVNYDGRESEEPQIWDPSNVPFSKVGADEHNPCGHWHTPSGLVYLGGLGGSFSPEAFTTWHCCPISVVLKDGKVWYITTTYAPMDEVWIVEYDPTTGAWRTIYTEKLDYWLWDQPWSEPEIAVQHLGDVTMLVLERPNTWGLGWPDHSHIVDIWVFVGETLESKTSFEYPGRSDTVTAFNKNVFTLTESGGVYTIVLSSVRMTSAIFPNETFEIGFKISTDLGATWDEYWTGYQLPDRWASKVPITYCEDTSTYYSLFPLDTWSSKLYKSINGGVTWTYVSTVTYPSGISYNYNICLILHCAHGIIALMHSRGFSMTSTDGGFTWTAIGSWSQMIYNLIGKSWYIGTT